MNKAKKKVIDDFLIDYYDALLKCSRELFRNKSHLIKKTSTEEPIELVNQLAQDLYDGKINFNEERPEELIKICITYLNNQFNWPESAYKQLHKNIKFKLKRKHHELVGENIIASEDQIYFAINHAHIDGEYTFDELTTIDDVELKAEEASDQAKEYILDLNEAGFTQDQIKRILQCNILYKTVLTQEERVLFKLYYIEGLTQSQIVERFRKVVYVSQASVSIQLKDLKNKILKHIAEWNY